MKTETEIKERLEELRIELRAECIGYGEIGELDHPAAATNWPTRSFCRENWVKTKKHPFPYLEKHG